MPPQIGSTTAALGHKNEDVTKVCERATQGNNRLGGVANLCFLYVSQTRAWKVATKNAAFSNEPNK